MLFIVVGVVGYGLNLFAQVKSKQMFVENQNSLNIKIG